MLLAKIYSFTGIRQFCLHILTTQLKEKQMKTSVVPL